MLGKRLLILDYMQKVTKSGCLILFRNRLTKLKVIRVNKSIQIYKKNIERGEKTHTNLVQVITFQNLLVDAKMQIVKKTK